MSITLIEVRTPQGTLLSLPLEDTDSGLIVQQLTGLDPVKATIVSSSFSAMDGEQYQSSRREKRNITLQFGIEPDWLTDSVRGIRSKLYDFFMPKSQVELRFYMADGLVVNVSGRVESFESALFTNEPTVDISVLCFDPDFVDTTPIVLSHSTVASSTDHLETYEGTVETGFVFVLNVDRTLTEFTIYVKGSDDIVRTLDLAASLVAGDTVTISTVAGAKSVMLTRSGVQSSLLYGMPPQSSWLEFMPGTNRYRVYATGAAIPYTITYTPRYGGL